MLAAPLARTLARPLASALTGFATRNIEIIAFTGDSITEAMNAPALIWNDGGYGAMAYAYTGGRFEPALNSATGLHHFAQTGKRTLQIQSEANLLPGALASSADTIFLHAGTNDYGDGRTTDQVRDTLLEMWLAIRNTGKRPIASTVLPSTYTGAQAAWIVELNGKIRTAAAANGVLLCDWTNLLDAGTDTGVAAAGMLADQLHPSRQGAAILGKALADFLDPYLLDSTAEAWFTAAEASVLAGTNGRFLTGSPLATGYEFYAGTGATNTSSIVARADGRGNWQQFAYTDATPATAANFMLSIPNAGVQGIAVGEKFQLGCELEIIGSSGFKALYLLLRPHTVSSERTEFLTSATLTGTMPAPSRRMMLRTSVITATALTDRIYGRLNFAGSGTYRVGRFTLRRF